MLTLLKRWWFGDVTPSVPTTIETIDDLVIVCDVLKSLGDSTFTTTPWDNHRLRVVHTHYSEFIRDILEICVAVRDTTRYKPYTSYLVLLEDWFTDDKSYPVDLNDVCKETAHCLQQLINLCNKEVDKSHVENVLSRYSQSLLTVIEIITVCRNRVSQ